MRNFAKINMDKFKAKYCPKEMPCQHNQSFKWGWMMNYCKLNHIPPAQTWAWKKAEQAFINAHGDQQKTCDCTHPKHPDNVTKRRAEEKAKEIHVEAYDEAGNTFDKIVTCRHKNDGTADVILSFGWPCEYSIASLLKYNYPLKKPLCIDAGGRNHKDHAVYIKAEDVNKYIEMAQNNCWDH